MIKHNKKRNTLLIYEFLAQSLINSIVNGDETQAKIIKNIIKEYFKKGTQLYKEYRLMKALATITTKSDSTIEKIFEDVKAFSQHLDKKLLNKEKTKLITEIHNKIGDKNFYKYDVSDYIKYATIQNLINEYHANDKKDFESQIKISIFEDNIKKAIIDAEEQQHGDIELEDKKIYNNVTTRLIIEKFNEKYKSLNSLQRAIIINHGLKHTDNTTMLIVEGIKKINEKISRIKADQDIDQDKDLISKLDKVKNTIANIDTSNITESVIAQTIQCAEILNYEE